MVLNGAIGAKLHIPFSVAVRAGFGFYFAYFCIISRSILAMFWLGIQGASGAQCITIMITAIWPSYASIANTLPASAGITSQGMIRYDETTGSLGFADIFPVISFFGSSNFPSS
jgi:NCS1 family nucleobase:cation symporter-1